MMGWMIVFDWNDLVSNINTVSFVFLVMGGILYSLGTIFYTWKLFKFNHMIWHIFVILGSAAHVVSVYFLV